MPKPKTLPPEINQTAIGDGNLQIAGDHNTVTVNQTFGQKVTNVFKGINIIINKVIRGDDETIDQRNRRILLNHVENFWVKGVLEKSLYGEILIELGIKEEPGAVKTYPWGIKREETGETLPAGTTMLEIFEQIGMGRSLLILGAPGSGKTTMLLELTRQLIERARKDETELIPMVFNLASWTKKQTLAQWLAEQLNLIYYVPKKTAPDWISGNKLLLLLDGLDEVRAESRAQCVEAINAFRKENGLTSLAISSRSQNYKEINTKLSFDGAIEVQPLSQKQIIEYFNRFGKEMMSLEQVIKKDSALREMAETPLFLSIMILAYQNKTSAEITVSKDVNIQRRSLFDTYIEQMFIRLEWAENGSFEQKDLLRGLSWLAKSMVKHNQMPYLLERMQPIWLVQKNQVWYRLADGLIVGLSWGLMTGLGFGLAFGLNLGMLFGVSAGLFMGVSIGRFYGLSEIQTVDSLVWDWQNMLHNRILQALIFFSLIISSITGVIISLIDGLLSGIYIVLAIELPSIFYFGLMFGFSERQVDHIVRSGQRLSFTIRNMLIVFFMFGPSTGLLSGILTSNIISSLAIGLMGSLFGGMAFGGDSIIRHYVIRFILARSDLLPWKLIPFLDYCCDLIFLRRVGGGYIFVHRLLMEHFAEMYTEKYAPKES